MLELPKLLEYREIQRKSPLDFYVENDVKVHAWRCDERVGIFFEGGIRVGQCQYFLAPLNDQMVAWLGDVTIYSEFDENTYRPRMLKILLERIKQTNEPKCSAVYAMAEDDDELKDLKNLGFKKVGSEVLKKKIS
jgi:hypothetical protein